MKIQREGKSPIIIGKRVVLGQGVLGVCNLLAAVWDWQNPDNLVPAAIAGLLAQVITFFAQIWVVNRFGVTTQEDV